MADPKSIRELNASFTVFQTMVWTIIGFIGTLILGSLAIYSQLGDLKTDLAVIKVSTSNTTERLKALDDRLGALDARIASMDKSTQEGRAEMLRAVSRVESQGIRTDPVVAGFYVTAFEATLIIQFLRPSIRTNRPAVLSVGSRVDEGRLQPLPEDAVIKSPRLRGVRYVIDDDNFKIALTGPGTDVVFAIL